MRIYKFAVAVLGALALTLPSTTAVAAQKKAQGAYGKPQGKAKSSVNRSKPGGGGHQGGGQHNAGNRSGGQQANRPNQQGNRTNAQKKGGNNVVAGNTVVVNGGGRGNPGNGYYDNGRYHDNDWDNDDDDFLEFVGKTAAITAGVSVVTAVIGSVSNDKPDDCQPVSSNGVAFLYCNGTYYQQVSIGYQVVAPPPR